MMRKRIGSRYVVILGALLVSLCFLFPVIIAREEHFNPDIYKTHEIDKYTYYRIIKPNEAPYSVPQPRPPDIKLPELSESTTHDVLRSVDVKADGEMDIVVVKRVSSEYYIVLVEVVVIDGSVSEAVEVKPVLQDRWVKTWVIAEYEGITEKNAMAKIVGQEVVEISKFYLNGGGGGGGSIVVVEAYQIIQGKNIFGWVLWELKAGGYFYVVEGYYVYDMVIMFMI
jgi:hypothetical protein